MLELAHEIPWSRFMGRNRDGYRILDKVALARDLWSDGIARPLPCVSVGKAKKRAEQRTYGKGYILAPTSLSKVAMDIADPLPQSSKDNE